MKTCNTIYAALILIICCFHGSTFAQGDHPMARFLDTNTVAFARLDLESLEPEAIHKKFEAIAAKHERLLARGQTISGFSSALKTQLTGAGAKEVYAFASLSDLVSGIFVVIPAQTDKTESIEKVAQGIAAMIPSHNVFRINEGILVSSEHTAKRLKEKFLPIRKDASDIMNMPKGTFDLVVAPSQDHLKSLRESIGEPFPQTAGSFFTEGGMTGELMADGMQKIQFTFDNADMNIALTFTGVQNVPPGKEQRMEAAGIIAEKTQWLLDQISGGTIPYWPRAKDFGKLPKSLTNAFKNIQIVQGKNQFSLTLDESQLTNISIGLVEMMGDKVGSTTQSFRMNSARTLALAMHNYYDAYRRFPGNILDEDGKPLLSWRVAILPFLEQNELYLKFKLDEPWDSEHNKPLLAEMPHFLRTDAELTAKGKTIWSRPSGEKFMGSCKEFGDLRDGSSNTLMIVGTTPEVAVYWSQPADLEPDLENIKAGIFSETQKQTTFARADGSGGVMSDKTTSHNLGLLLMFDDGEVLDHQAIQ